MKKKLLILASLFIFTAILGACYLKSSLISKGKESYVNYSEKEINERKIDEKYPQVDILPAKLVKNSKDIVGIYSLEWVNKEKSPLKKNLLKVNEDGTFIESRTWSNSSKEKEKNEEYTLLSGYVIDLEGEIFLKYANTIDVSEESIQKNSLESSYQQLDTQKMKSPVFVNGSFEVPSSKQNDSFKLIKVVPKETPRELTSTPLEVNELINKI